MSSFESAFSAFSAVMIRISLFVSRIRLQRLPRPCGPRNDGFKNILCALGGYFSDLVSRRLYVVKDRRWGGAATMQMIISVISVPSYEPEPVNMFFYAFSFF